MWNIIRNEWQYLFRSWLFPGATLGFTFVMLVSVFLGDLQVRKQTAAYQKSSQDMRQKWESIKAMNPHNAAHYGTYAFKPPTLLSSLDGGISSITGNVLRLEGHVQNEIVYSEASQMQTISRFGKLQSALLLQYIIPVLLIFLAFNAVSSEKQTGRLRLLILQGADPIRLLLGKTFAIWCYGIGLLLLNFLTHTLLNISYFSTDLLLRLSLLFITYALYYFVISGLTIYFSARWQNATLALTGTFGIWILWSIFLPNIALTSIEKWHILPSRNVFKASMKEDRSKGVDGHNPADQRQKALEQEVLQKYGVDSLSQLPVNFDGLVMQADEEYGNQVWDKHFGQLCSILARQKQSLQLMGLLSPFISLRNASIGFAATDNLHHQDFLLQAESYRRVFVKMLNDEHAYGGSRSGDWSWKADNAFFRSVPDFAYQPAPLGTMLLHYLPDVLVLLLWSVVIALLLFSGSQKMQIL